jgi:hypothetical protein
VSATLAFRLARTSAFAVVCLGLGVIVHLFGGGSLSTLGVAGGLGVAFAAALPLSARERSLGLILPLLAAVQAVMHVLFSLGHTLSVEAAGHLHSASGLVPDLGMLVAHGWATGFTALWLARGEAALWALLRRLAAGLCRVLAIRSVPFWMPPVTVFSAEPHLLRSAVLRHAVSRRGPPRVVSTI